MAHGLLIAVITASLLLLVVVYLAARLVFGGKAKDGYVFESDGPQAHRAHKAGH